MGDRQKESKAGLEGDFPILTWTGVIKILGIVSLLPCPVLCLYESAGGAVEDILDKDTKKRLYTGANIASLVTSVPLLYVLTTRMLLLGPSPRSLAGTLRVIMLLVLVHLLLVLVLQPAWLKYLFGYCACCYGHVYTLAINTPLLWLYLSL
eukprot:Nk52_evm13s241 gene=Nk52_evmTU13s241